MFGAFLLLLFYFSFKSNLGTTKTNTRRSGELLKGDIVEYITLSDVRIEMAHSINALQTLLESIWAELWQRIAAAGHEILILICAARVCVSLDSYFYKDSQPCNSVHITNQFTHTEEILNPDDKSSSDRMTKLYAGDSMMLIPVLPRWSCSLHYVIQPSNSSVRVWKAKRRLYWEPVKNKRANLCVAISKCCLNHSFVKKIKKPNRSLFLYNIFNTKLQLNSFSFCLLPSSLHDRSPAEGCY